MIIYKCIFTVIGAYGHYDTSHERRMKDMTASYRAQSVSCLHSFLVVCVIFIYLLFVFVCFDVQFGMSILRSCVLSANSQKERLDDCFNCGCCTLFSAFSVDIMNFALVHKLYDVIAFRSDLNCHR